MVVEGLQKINFATGKRIDREAWGVLVSQFPNTSQNGLSQAHSWPIVYSIIYVGLAFPCSTISMKNLESQIGAGVYIFLECQGKICFEGSNIDMGSRGILGYVYNHK